MSFHFHHFQYPHHVTVLSSPYHFPPHAAILSLHPSSSTPNIACPLTIHPHPTHPYLRPTICYPIRKVNRTRTAITKFIISSPLFGKVFPVITERLMTQALCSSLPLHPHHLFRENKTERFAKFQMSYRSTSAYSGRENKLREACC